MTSTRATDHLTSKSIEIVFQHNTLNKLLIFSQVRLNLYVNIRINKVQTLRSTAVSCVHNANKLAQSHSYPRRACLATHRAHGAHSRSSMLTLPHKLLSHKYTRILSHTFTQTENSYDYYQISTVTVIEVVPKQVLYLTSTTRRHQERNTGYCTLCLRTNIK